MVSGPLEPNNDLGHPPPTNQYPSGVFHSFHVKPAKGKAAKVADKAVEMYSEQAALRATISAIPWIGSSIDAFLSTKGQKIVQNRITSLLDALKDEMRDIQEGKVDKPYLESDEFFDLTLKALEAATRTKEIAKIGMYARILKGAVVGRREAEFSGEDAIRVILDLTPRQMEVARAFIFSSETDLGRAKTTFSGRSGLDGITSLIRST
jgi:hypothetical protein